ncbi:hypothetical protein GCM10009125_03850 [Castellaniella daejeonensis]|jgi:hypothetical protein|uniref:Uncharacterized protein n=1 Tax=Castellaniella daejeonensis TaxID=659013 RepID=A0ABN0TCH3_9BURK
MEMVRRSGIDRNGIGQAGLVDEVLEHALGCGGAADIARTDKKYLMHDGESVRENPEIGKHFLWKTAKKPDI